MLQGHALLVLSAQHAVPDCMVKFRCCQGLSRVNNWDSSHKEQWRSYTMARCAFY